MKKTRSIHAEEVSDTFGGGFSKVSEEGDVASRDVYGDESPVDAIPSLPGQMLAWAGIR